MVSWLVSLCPCLHVTYLTSMLLLEFLSSKQMWSRHSLSNFYSWPANPQWWSLNLTGKRLHNLIKPTPPPLPLYPHSTLNFSPSHDMKPGLLFITGMWVCAHMVYIHVCVHMCVDILVCICADTQSWCHLSSSVALPVFTEAVPLAEPRAEPIPV